MLSVTAGCEHAAEKRVRGKLKSLNVRHRRVNVQTAAIALILFQVIA
jgi:hypothetical protein